MLAIVLQTNTHKKPVYKLLMKFKYVENLPLYVLYGIITMIIN